MREILNGKSDKSRQEYQSQPDTEAYHGLQTAESADALAEAAGGE